MGPVQKPTLKERVYQLLVDRNEVMSLKEITKEFPDHERAVISKALKLLVLEDRIKKVSRAQYKIDDSEPVKYYKNSILDRSDQFEGLKAGDVLGKQTVSQDDVDEIARLREELRKALMSEPGLDTESNQ